MKQEFTKRLLNPFQLKLVETIEQVGFGRIEHIRIRDGQPCDGQTALVVHEIRLTAEIESRDAGLDADLTLKSEFERLFDQLSQVRDGLVDIEIRHRAPCRIVVTHRCEELRP